jgi:hypothetical protein
LPSVPNLRLLLVREKYAATILHFDHSIFPKRLECCIDRLKPPVKVAICILAQVRGKSRM